MRGRGHGQDRAGALGVTERCRTSVDEQQASNARARESKERNLRLPLVGKKVVSKSRKSTRLRARVESLGGLTVFARRYRLQKTHFDLFTFRPIASPASILLLSVLAHLPDRHRTNRLRRWDLSVSLLSGTQDATSARRRQRMASEIRWAGSEERQTKVLGGWRGEDWERYAWRRRGIGTAG